MRFLRFPLALRPHQLALQNLHKGDMPAILGHFARNLEIEGDSDINHEALRGTAAEEVALRVGLLL